MSKTYIVSRNGGTVTKAPINDNKIPIYDTEQDAESDLANLAEGQIYATKEGKFDVDDMKQYIRKQNVLSDYEEITSTIGRTAATATTMNFDGEIIHWCRDTNYEEVYVNETMIFRQKNISGTTEACSFPVKKGDTVYMTLTSDSKAFARFYKDRDYTDR